MKKEHWNKGRKFTKEHRDKLSESHKGLYLGEKHPNWKGGRIITSDGYVMLYSQNHPLTNYKKYVLEHRLVMEKKIGRYLTKEEVVHHINENKQDNRIENLKLCSSLGKHRAEHSKGITKDKRKYQKEYMRRRRENNPKLKEYNRKYMKRMREENPERVKEIRKKYRERHKDKLKKQWKDYYEKNKEKLKQKRLKKW